MANWIDILFLEPKVQIIVSTVSLNTGVVIQYYLLIIHYSYSFTEEKSSEMVEMSVLKDSII